MPDLSGAPKLKQLILQRCIGLSKIHKSLGNLECLIQLNLNGCKCLESLPENLGNIKGLEELDVSETAITELPSSFVLLKNIKVLSLHRCKGLSSISSNKLISFPLIQKRRVDPTDILGRTLSNLWSLTELDLSYCNLQAIPDSFGCLSSLKYLNLKGNNFVYLPESTLSNLWSLTLLNISDCNLQAIPNSLGCLSSLKELDLKGNNFVYLPESTLSNLWSLTILNLSDCNLQAIPDSLGCLSSLEYLDLKGNNFVCLPESTTQLSNLGILLLRGCTHLRSLPKLPSNVGYIFADGCASLEILPLRPEDGPYPNLYLLGCDKLINNEDYDDMLLANLRHRIIKVSLSLSLSLSLS